MIIKGRDEHDLIKNLNDWLKDGRTIKNIELNVQKDKAESHTFTFEETPRTIEYVNRIITEKFEVKEEVDLMDRVENISDLSNYLGMSIDELAFAIGYSSSSGFRDLHKASEKTHRKRAMDMAINLDVDYDLALKLVSRDFRYKKEKIK